MLFKSYKGIFANILNLSISPGVYPSKLRMAKIIAIFNQDDDTDVNNYRLITLPVKMSTGSLEK